MDPDALNAFITNANDNALEWYYAIHPENRPVVTQAPGGAPILVIGGGSSPSGGVSVGADVSPLLILVAIGIVVWLVAR